MQKAVEPEIDAGFPKHNYSQLNCSCYSYPSNPRLQCLFRLDIYGISKWLHTTATACVKARAGNCKTWALDWTGLDIMSGPTILRLLARYSVPTPARLPEKHLFAIYNISPSLVYKSKRSWGSQ